MFLGISKQLQTVDRYSTLRIQGPSADKPNIALANTIYTCSDINNYDDETNLQRYARKRVAY